MEILKNHNGKNGIYCSFCPAAPNYPLIKTIQCIRILFVKIQKKSIPCQEEESKLDKFMIDHLCCKKCSDYNIKTGVYDEKPFFKIYCSYAQQLVQT